MMKAKFGKIPWKIWALKVCQGHPKEADDFQVPSKNSKLDPCMVYSPLGGGNSNIFFENFHPENWKISYLTCAYFFRWVGSTTNQTYIYRHRIIASSQM